MTPKVTFVIPCYNYGGFVGDCIQSILNMKGKWEIEILAIDDASTDNTAQVLRSFKDKRLTISTHQKNQGHVVTINEGLYAAKGEYVARIDADDRYRPDFLEETVPLLDRDTEIGAIYGNVNLIDAHGVIHESRPTHHYGADRKHNIYVELLGNNFICAPTLIARNGLWRKALPILEGLSYSDWYLNLQMARRAPFLYRNVTLADYRVHSQNLHTTLIVNKNEEPTTFRVLDLLYSETESDPTLEWNKKKARREVYGRHYSLLARKYFGAKRFEDARRCFLQTMRWSPHLALTSEMLRLQAAILMGEDSYAKLKRLLSK